MGVYTEAAHKAAHIAEQQADQLPCQIPANNLLYCFLLEARNVRMEFDRDLDSGTDNLSRAMRNAAAALMTHTSRVYDYQTALDMKFVGPALAQVRPAPAPRSLPSIFAI
jgi:hypothetical protein